MLQIFDHILPLPVKFDANEWFILLNLGLGFTLVALLPKRYPNAINILLSLFTASVAIVMDHAIASPPLDLYDINDHKKYELMDVISYFMYAPFGCICAYFYHKFQPKRLYFVAYVAAWALFSVGYEWFALKCHVFRYYKWDLSCSFSIYVVATTVHLRLFQVLLKKFDEMSAKPVEGH